MATVFLNGRFVSQDDTRVSAFDAGLQHGVGLFETILGGIDDDQNSWAFRLEAHLERLTDSARLLGLSDQLRAAPLGQAVHRTIAESGLNRARVRVTVTGGDLNLLGRRVAGTGERADESGPEVQPTILIVAQPATEYPPEMFDRGVVAAIADLRINPLDPMAGHKTLTYWARLRELRAAAERHAGEALVFQVTNHLAGGCVSNAFVVKDGRLLTPIARGQEAEPHAPTSRGVAVPSPVLPGITRAWAIEWAEARGIEVERRMLTIEDVLSADEVFLTNSSWGVLPVVRVEKETIGGGGAGELTSSARQGWLGAIEAASQSL